MRLSTLLLSSALALGLFQACAASEGPDADESLSVPQVEEQAKAADVPTLEAIVASYEAEIDEASDTWEELKAKAKEVGGQALDELMGATEEGKASAAEGLEELEAAAKEAAARLEDLRQKLEVYVKELATRE